MHQTLPRRTIVLSGNRDWSHGVVRDWLAPYDSDQFLWLGDRLPEGVSTALLARREQLLGDEYVLAVIDAWAGFDPEQFGAVSGTVRGGGALILLLPPDEEWLRYPDPAKQRIALWPHTPATLPNRFIARTLRILRNHRAVEWFDSANTPPAALDIVAATLSRHYRSNDQQRAICALHHVVHGHRRRPLVLLADRGRGKSSVLGMAARELLDSGLSRIVVTAPHRNAVHALFAHAAQDGADTRLSFIPPDELLRNQQPCDLLLVDEAAAIPTPLLEQLLHHYPRIVFSTTLHGYEGTGRGFELRFFKILEKVAPGWQKLELNEPIRWCDNDPLEALANDLLLLAAEPPDNAGLGNTVTADCRYERLDSDAIAADEVLLQQLFGLLILAHYRTSPLDLRQLLDSPATSLHLLRQQGQLVAAAITLREGGFDAALAHEIYMGRRRPRGHLAAQALAFYCGMEEAPQLTTERIMRIAVHPLLQQQGLGSRLLQEIASHAQGGCDYLSASFGATTELLRFWRRNGLRPVRIGMAREASSGHHSALVMRPFSTAAQQIFARTHRRFLSYLPLQLCEPLRELEPALSVELLSDEAIDYGAELDSDDWRDLHSFAFGKRGYEVCIGALHKLTRHLLTTSPLLETLAHHQRTLLIGKVLHHHPWREVALTQQLSGEDAAVDSLRATVRHLLAHTSPPVSTPQPASV